MHRDGQAVLRLAVHKGQHQYQYRTAHQQAQTIGQPARSQPPNRRQQRQTKGHLRGQDRHTDPHALLDKKRNGRERKPADWRHKVLMRDLSFGHPQHDVYQMQRIAFVFGDIKPTFEQRHATQSHQNSKQHCR